MTSPKKQPENDKYFSGFLICAKCGYRLKTYETHKQQKDRKQKTVGYVCGNQTLKTCSVGSMSHKKVEAAFEEYISRVADFDCADEILLNEKPHKSRGNQAQMERHEGTRRLLDAKEKEAVEMYVANLIDFEEYRKIKKRIDFDRAFIAAEQERLKLTAEEITVDHSDIILNFKENWRLLDNAQRRAFLQKFVERIEINSEKPEGAYFCNIEILGVKWMGQK